MDFEEYLKIKEILKQSKEEVEQHAVIDADFVYWVMMELQSLIDKEHEKIENRHKAMFGGNSG